LTIRLTFERIDTFQLQAPGGTQRFKRCVVGDGGGGFAYPFDLAGGTRYCHGEDACLDWLNEMRMACYDRHRPGGYVDLAANDRQSRP